MRQYPLLRLAAKHNDTLSVRMASPPAASPAAAAVELAERLPAAQATWRRRQD
eukprot:CAMPEP_0115848682 /NCGR_PEP_ID=MMETSP0287-20121206/11053_1 /TAXON_ID=412157 /ORGANISM="Chrysochromulina rotalis, Strain UIO044" /LENGTH=52 /DNA_ID=CAMNT_0003302613 /DNA_START=550 /DNA_END=705 /DNA_ORIENTATION=-